MEKFVKDRLEALRNAREQLIAQVNIANGAIAELENLVREGEKTAAAEALAAAEPVKVRRGPKAGVPRIKRTKKTKVIEGQLVEKELEAA